MVCNLSFIETSVQGQTPKFLKLDTVYMCPVLKGSLRAIPLYVFELKFLILICTESFRLVTLTIGPFFLALYREHFVMSGGRIFTVARLIVCRKIYRRAKLHGPIKRIIKR